MQKSACFQLGIVKRPYSFKGELVAKFTVKDGGLYLDADRLFVEVGDDLVPYFVEAISGRPKGEFRLKLEEVETEAEVRRLSGCGLYLPLTEKQHEELAYHQWIDFEVVDQKAGSVGSVTAFLEIPGNPQLEVSQAAHSFMIPLNAAFITRVDEAAKTIYTALPEGLAELDE